MYQRDNCASSPRLSFNLPCCVARNASILLLNTARHVVPELLKRNLPTTLISDNMMGTLFAHGEIAKLCFFYDGLAPEGPLGICGSLLAVQLARLHGVAIELFSGDGHSESTSDSDVSTFLGEPICPAGVAVSPLGAEVVPWALFKS